MSAKQRARSIFGVRRKSVVELAAATLISLTCVLAFSAPRAFLPSYLLVDHFHPQLHPDLDVALVLLDSIYAVHQGRGTRRFGRKEGGMTRDHGVSLARAMRNFVQVEFWQAHNILELVADAIL